MATILSTEVTNAAKGVLIDGFKELVGGARAGAARAAGTGDFIAGPEPSNPILGWQHRAGRAVCDRWARGPREEILPGDDLVLRESCGPYLGPNMPGSPTTAPGGPGGQCPGSTYTAAWERRVSLPGGGFGWVPTEAGVVFSGPVEIVPGPDNGGLGCSEGLQLVQWQIQSAGGGNATGLSGGCVDTAPGYRNLALTVVSGPDDCGPTPGVYDAGRSNPGPDPNPGPVGSPPGFPFPDLDISIGPGGDILIDFGDGEPPEVIDPSNPEPTEDPGGGGGGGGGDSGDPTDPGNPGPSQGTGNGGEAEGAAPEGTELVGVLVTVAQQPGDANRFANNPKQPFRGIGYVRMGFPDRLGLDISGGTVISPQFFHAQQRGLTNWAVAANTGFNLTVQPYFREITS